MANHLQVPDDWALAIPSSAVTDTNTGKGISIMVSSSLGPPAPLLNPKPLLTMSYEVIQRTFELLAGQVAGVTFVTIYMHNSTTTSAGLQPFSTPDINGLIAALEQIPNFRCPTANIVVGGDFNFPSHRHHLEAALESIGLLPVYNPQAPLPTRQAAALDLIFWKEPDIRPVATYTVDNPTSDHKMVVADFEGVEVSNVLSPGDLQPPFQTGVSCPSWPPSKGQKPRPTLWQTPGQLWAKACVAPDPITAMGSCLMDVAVQHFGAKKWRRQHRLPWWNNGLTKLNRKLRRAKAKA